MADLIDRNNAIKFALSFMVEYCGAAFDEDMQEGMKKALAVIPSTQPETCEGCKHLGKWENEVEYGYPSPCTRCKRRVEDHYER